GKTFIGGADIREFGQPPAAPLLPAVIERIESFDKPVIAAIQGAALGGGLEVALACHHRIASLAAQLGLPEVKLGLVPGAGGTQRLPRLVGIPAAIALIGSGRSVKAAEALALGIVDAVADGHPVEAAITAAPTSTPKAKATKLSRIALIPAPPAQPPRPCEARFSPYPT
ncbi:MAG: enoyl-CoA hydratase-related protein, partial [Hyphomonas sp.]